MLNPKESKEANNKDRLRTDTNFLRILHHLPISLNSIETSPFMTCGRNCKTSDKSRSYNWHKGNHKEKYDVHAGEEIQILWKATQNHERHDVEIENCHAY
jgi:hypothetical protein